MHYAYADYLSLEESSPVRHEYLDGEIYAMAGGTPDHAALAVQVLALIRARLPAGCRGFSSDLRVRMPATGLSTYPDGAVVCGPTPRASDDSLAVTNPVLLLDVTSPSSEDYDRGEKLRHYQTLASAREIVIVSHREPRLTLHRRDDDGRWSSVEAVKGQALALSTSGATLAVDDVYRDGLEDAGR
jgi:Uma2 family endonuclease